jgi:sodium/bile acid cotransporter 7
VKRLTLDRFTGLLLLTVLLASLVPCRGQGAIAFAALTKAAIVLLFFMHGAKLSREAVVAGLGAWRLHLLVLGATFVIFPTVALAVLLIPASLLDPGIGQGIVYLSILPSTVQSSIALTAIAGGNVAAAVCSASLSNILGVFITPMLAALLLPHMAHDGDGGVMAAIVDIATTLLLPFLLGHLSRRWTAGFVGRHKSLLMRLDRGSILLVVYTAFSAAVIEGLWSRITPADLVAILALNALLLAVVLLVTARIARMARFAVPDEIVLVFCGSKKSLASGVPMAAALFPVAQVGAMVLPLMIFHQLQLLVCAVLARRYAGRVHRSDLAATAGRTPDGLSESVS